MHRQGGPDPAAKGVDERMPLATLAADAALVKRVVDGRGLARFSRLCDAGDAIGVALSFNLEKDGSIRINGDLTGSLRVDCHRCQERVPVALNDKFCVHAVLDEASATRIGATRDVLTLSTGDPTLAELIEDELILALPQRPCTDTNCAKAPPLVYPAAAPDADKPFRSLEALKKEDY